ncbi:COPII coat assembly protein sec16 [Cordyceps militaris CM01]|uniref:Protein transport protein sec16 n=1 Tax=Cordyceps militaris (strain CM01) TaxID=983644 RepID=G3JQP5_CORMM|nr:COPII coat assembly protein sec16 [Cordyceps militaris CM01]EGX89549.1 COPII coat assembly protein sec16 [Cordyceps militaris CM01]
MKSLSLLGLVGLVTAAAVPSNDGFPMPSKDQQVALEKQAGGKLPNVALPKELGPGSTTAFQLITFNELFETAYFDSLLQNITSGVQGYEAENKEELIKIFSTVRAQEEIHVLAAQAALMAANTSFVPSACKYMFPTTNLTQAVNLAETFTAVVLGALQGANVLFAQENVTIPIQLISSVIGQEGEQNGYYRTVLKEVPSESPFLTAVPAAFAFSALQMFVVPGSCPYPLANIGLPIFPPMMVNGEAVAALEPKDQMLSFSADLSMSEQAMKYAGGNGTDLFLTYTTGQSKPFSMEISNVKWDGGKISFDAAFPFSENVMGGFSHAALTTGNVFESANDLTHCTLAGPGIIQSAPVPSDAHDTPAKPTIPEVAPSSDLGDGWMAGDGQVDDGDAWLESEGHPRQSMDVEAAPKDPVLEPTSPATFNLAKEPNQSQNPVENGLQGKPTATDPFDTNEDENADAWFVEKAAQEPLQPDNAPAPVANDTELTKAEYNEPADLQPEHKPVAEVATASETKEHQAQEAEEQSRSEAETARESVPDGQDTQPSHQLSQHSSSMSFARTVSHEISFNDDDESDWTLPRSNTDQFKFMAPTDRTNSFPAVPPAQPTRDLFPAHPLPSSQALDVVEEAEKNAFAQDDTEEQNMFWENDDPEGNAHESFQTIGGDIGDAATEASQSRFEEGLPLIPAVEQSGRNPFNSFEEDDAGDDFFSNVQHGKATAEDLMQPIQRKSTLQVIGNTLDREPITQQPAFDTLDEHADEDHYAKALADAFGSKPKDESQTIAAKAPADLSAKWQEAFGAGDDDDFLLDDTENNGEAFDPAGFLGSDDEGFLLDDDEDAPAATTTNAPAPMPYLPSQVPTPPKPVSSPATSYGYAAQPPQQTPYGAAFGYAPAALPRADAPKAESFADKAKGGYASPYDLPNDLVTMNVKPRKRPSLPSPAQEPTPPPSSAPPHAANAYAPPPGSVSSAPPAQAPTSRSASRQGSFFEDLPMTAKPRPASRQSLRAASPSKQYGNPSRITPVVPPPPAMNQQYQHPPIERPAAPENSVANLVTPPKVNPYATLQGGSAPPSAPATNATRYSPAPAQQHKGSSAPPPAAPNRFSPAPPLPRQNTSPTHNATASASQTYLPHLPRTSSPLAQFEIHHDKSTTGGDAGHLDRRASYAHEPRLNRMSSLPSTREVDEEEETQAMTQAGAFQQPPAGAQYSPAPQQTPGAPNSLLASPEKRITSNYLPQSALHQPHFAPPMRAQTQSPGATRSSFQQARPTSAHTNAAPSFGQAAQPATTMPVRGRGASLTLNLVPPTDGREHDPLQRWQGVPIISWGVGGAMVTSFPKSTPRYTMNQSAPTMLRTPGEVKVKSMKEIEPLPQQLAQFPGPLRGKSKKKDALAWLSSGITALERELPDVSLTPQLSLEAKRSIERLLLWRILRVFIEFDGHLEGTPAVEKAVREVLSPQGTVDSSLPIGSSVGQLAALTGMKADDVDSASVESIKDSLLKGDRESAVWAAVDKRLWGHAMLIAHTTSPELYGRVAQEFVRKEVNYPGHSNQSLGAFYKVLSGNFEDCVDELVPVHARAGMQLMSTEVGIGATQDVLSGLENWRETVSLVLSNRSENDVRGLNALGKLLSGYGRAEAAQICFIFSRSISVFGGIDDPNADFVLVGADHHTQSDQFAKETEALQLSEVYEYGLTLSGAANLAAGAPHLAGYKLQHATVLAEHGYRDKALQYCDAILNSMSAQTRRSPYHHPLLEASVDDFMRRLKQAPKDDGTSWMSKPSMNKVSDSMWNRFNKFVAGDEDGNGQPGADGEHGPFARIASTPNISRSPSISNFETYGTSPSYGAPALPPQASAANSRYAPATTPAATMTQNPYEFVSQQPAPAQQQTNGRSSNEHTRSPYEPSYPGASGVNTGYPGFNQSAPELLHPPSQPGVSPYQPHVSNIATQPYGLQPSPSITADLNPNPNYGYQGYQPTGGYEPAQPAKTENLNTNDTAEVGYQPPSTQSYEFEPPSMQAYGYEPSSTPSQSYEPPSADPQGHETPSGQFQAYEPSSTQSYGYEPPSYQPDLTYDAEEDVPKPKKNFMDDDQDEIPTLRPADSNTKADLDRENQEMFRKVAEEEAKRAAEAAAGKKSGGWGFGGWFGATKKADLGSGEASPAKAIRAKLGESNSFVYDPDLKRWINKKAGAEQTEAPKASAPPPRGGAPRSVSGTPPPSGPPVGSLLRSASTSNLKAGTMPPPSGLGISAPPPMMRSDSNASTGDVFTPPSGPPTRPATSISNASSIDDLLGAVGPRKASGKKPRKTGRYVDVMAK